MNNETGGYYKTIQATDSADCRLTQPALFTEEFFKQVMVLPLQYQICKVTHAQNPGDQCH